MIGRPEGQSLPKNCAKNQNSKQSTINQMSYIQKFFQQCLPLFYLQELKQHLTDPQFLTFNNQHNIFDFTLDLILSSQNCLHSISKQRNNINLALLCQINYEQLRDVRLPAKEQDTEIVKFLKCSLKYVHMQMFQILIRLSLCFIQSMTATQVSSTLCAIIQDIALIYPALKIEISFSHPQINLCHWFEKYLNKITQNIPANDISRVCLEKIMDKSQFIGPLEKLFKRYVEITPKKTTQQDSKLEKSVANQQLLSKLSKNIQCVNEEGTKVQKLPSISGQKQQKFDDFELFRNKKRKMIIKERLKSTQGGYKTPYRQKDMSHSNTPNTSKTEHLIVRSDTTENNASSILYRRLLSKSKYTMPDRTLYFGQTRKFLPKKTSSFDPELYIQNITATSLTNQYSNHFEQTTKKTEKKPAKFMMLQAEDSKIFCVPQTPKPDPFRKQRTSSTQLNLQIKPFKL